jgi:hypothetical protein
MLCKQCSGDNDDRAIECGYCGAGLRRPYPYDALGEWLEELDFDSPGSNTIDTVLLVISIAVAAGVTGLLYRAEAIHGWVAAGALALGLIVVLMSTVEILLSGFLVRRARARYRNEVAPSIDELRRETEMEPWRLVVVIHEALPKRSTVACHFLPSEASDE